jgi:hypothetical protein
VTEISFDRKRAAVPPGPAGLQECPGRNDPRYGAWMLEHLVPSHVGKPRIADPMCGGGQLWMLTPTAVVYGCELREDRAAIARQNGVIAFQGNAETWQPCEPVDLVAFSFPYRNCDHDSGSTKHQADLVKSKGLQSMQAIEQVPCFWRVFAQIATWCGDAPVAVIHKNYIDGQRLVDEIEELAGAMVMAGFEPPERYYRVIPPGPTETWKVARGEYSAKTGKTHRVVDREYVLVTRRRRE